MKTPLFPGDDAAHAQFPERRRLLRTGAALVGSALFGSVMARPAAARAAPAASAGRANARGRGGKALIVNAHQRHAGISEGRLNRTMAALIGTALEAKGFEVNTTVIDSGYDTQQEVDKHLWADVIVTQSPVFWFGNPWIYKKYVDDVFTAGLVQGSFLAGDGRSAGDPSAQYGSGGKLQGKRYLLSLTMNSPQAAFDDPAQALHQGRSLDEVFAANTANYRFCGADVLPVFACYDVVSAPQVASDMQRLKLHLEQHVG